MHVIPIACYEIPMHDIFFFKGSVVSNFTDFCPLLSLLQFL